MRYRWVVIVDVAPPAAVLRLERALRDLGFVPLLPCCWQSHWLDVPGVRLRTAIRRARRGCHGTVLIVPVATGGVTRG